MADSGDLLGEEAQQPMTLTRPEFVEAAKYFVRRSDQLGDGWKLCTWDEGIVFLSKSKQTACESGDWSGQGSTKKTFISVEYHVVYSESYQVPVLYFTAHNQNGQVVSVEDLVCLLSSSSEQKDQMLSVRYSALTQMPHPLFGTPFYQVHPCNTSKWLSRVSTGKKFSKTIDYISAWLSFVGPYVGLQMANEYGLPVLGSDDW